MPRPPKVPRETKNVPSNDDEFSQLDPALRKAIDGIETQYGKGSIFILDSNAHIDIPVISTGSLTVDIATGVGGIPRGRVTEIYGPESSGKTTLCLHAIAQAQQAGGAAAFIDMEHALDPNWAKRLGCNLSKLIISQPESGEQALQITESLIKSGALAIVVIDSVAALVPRVEIEGEMGDSHVGLQARLMAQALRKLNALIKSTNVAVVFTNQIREKIGVTYGSNETQPGGRALKFYASLRMDIRKLETIKGKEDAIGSHVRVRVTKNKVAPPFREAEFDIMYVEGGISRAGEIIDLATELGIIEKRGAFYRYNDDLIGQGREASKKALVENPKLAFELENAVRLTYGIKLLDAPPPLIISSEEVSKALSPTEELHRPGLTQEDDDISDLLDDGDEFGDE